MSNMTDGQINADTETAKLLGHSWFNWKDDIESSNLGAEVKRYEYHLSYQDYFVVTVHEHGASGYYTRTGAVKTFRNPSVAFTIARQLKGRDRVLNSLME